MSEYLLEKALEEERALVANLRQALETSRAETREAQIAHGEALLERDRLKGELAERGEIIDRFEGLAASYRAARLRAETAEGLLREETDACVCETIDPREVGRTVTSQTQVACGECWWCRVRAFLAGRGGSPTERGGETWALAQRDAAEERLRDFCAELVKLNDAGDAAQNDSPEEYDALQGMQRLIEKARKLARAPLSTGGEPCGLCGVPMEPCGHCPVCGPHVDNPTGFPRTLTCHRDATGEPSTGGEKPGGSHE